jgi:hypothetical protein
MIFQLLGLSSLGMIAFISLIYGEVLLLSKIQK